MNKNKRGFTLMELLVVIAIVSIVSVGATIAFSNINDSTAEKELENTYLDIQRAASLYLDLHNSSLESFIEKKESYIKLYVLQEQNYVDGKLENPVTGDDIDLNNYVKLYVPVDNSKVDSCIISIDESGNEKCIANSRGKRCGCCDLEINSTTNPACN